MVFRYKLFLLLLLEVVLLCKTGHTAKSKDWVDEIFGVGLSAKTLAEKSRKHLASSTEDLLILLDTEVKLVKKLKNETQVPEIVKSYLLKADEIREDDFEEYVYHPINAYHLMKRASSFWPKVKKMINSSEDEIIYPEKSDFQMGASFGLVHLQILHKLNMSEMLRGILRNPTTGAIYQARQNLSSEDAILLASSSKSISRFQNQVEWLEAALEAAKAEKRSEKYQNKIVKMIKKAIKEHDQLIFNKGFLRMVESEIVFTKETTYDEDLMDTHNLKVHLNDREEARAEIKMYQNLTIPDVPFKLGYFTDKINQELCSGKQIRPIEMDTDLKCFYLHYQNPYLRLCPFKYEPINLVPHVGMFHDFASINEVRKIRQRARGHMKSTPLRTGIEVEDYTRHRTSKVMYINEHSTEIARIISDRIDRANNFRTYSEKFASENYQVMNYGIGGSIVGHVDSTGEKEDLDHQEHPRFGGPRFCTFMIYLTDVEAGGRTVFPTIGISVPPKVGSALFWFNLDSSGFLDTRNFHLGCPVVYGNKWIANKWVHWLSQMWNYPCHIKRKPYPIYSN